MLLGRILEAWRSPDWRPGRRWRLACVCTALAVLAVCGYGSWLVAADEPPVTTVEATGQPAAATVLRELASRADDPRPLTTAEVFPGQLVVAGPEAAGYQVLRVQALQRCAVAASGEIVALLETAGCSQVVRATLRSPDGRYVITAGLLNLADAAGAETVHGGIKARLDAETGRLRGLPAGAGTGGLGKDTTQLGWHVRGHFLAYAVIARSDGGRIYADDPEARQILSDLIEQHLRTRVLDRRAAARD
ncbi:hypothetical protein O7635_04820 [Asanoa sp. WMMD1127]|uniref:hypothetical protein n=1 Tax=Asanoa sp. WMMD1127 TaxID=3016107 RepID=UPI0024179A63|nr:hypothetical protein [Asanoa sp. WMMD1127]MDG4821178.1 hypothetical protein [Asanoa sp. WMMD1127]